MNTRPTNEKPYSEEEVARATRFLEDAYAADGVPECGAKIIASLDDFHHGVARAAIIAALRAASQQAGSNPNGANGMRDESAPQQATPASASEANYYRLAIKLLVAAGFVTEEKANEALRIANGFEGNLGEPPALHQPPSGEWVMVPFEPTEAMHTAHKMYGDTSDWWQAVIAAAPPADGTA